MTGRLHNKLCVVTGAARGIGFAIAERFAVEGGRVACVDVSARRMEPAADLLKQRGLDVRAYAVDVGERSQVASMFERIETDFGAPADVLVNNAVWARFQPLVEIDGETVRRMFACGLEGLMWTLQAAAPQMERRGGGSVINLCSTSAVQAMPNSIAYAALKAGVMGLTRAAAVELSPQRIRVNAIVPGMIGTPASVAQFDEATIVKRHAQMPLGRFGEPEEIASVATFLASDESSYVQGAGIVADGGWTIAAT
jgi:NAD(P)-dependent dehydrogenase (short-subunit alcohol dehydrogenase family)